MPPPEHHDDERRDGLPDGLPDDDRLLEAIRSPEAAPDAGVPDVHDAADVREPAPARATDADDPAVISTAELARLGGVVRSLSDDDLGRDDPPPSVWAGIAARTGIPSADPPAAPGGAVVPPPGPTAGRRADDPSDPVPLHARRRSGGPAWILGAVAAAAAVVLVVAGVLAFRSGDDEPVVVAAAAVDPLPDQPTGEARSVEARVVEADGGLELDLPLADAGLPAPDGFYEVWLIDQNVVGMVSLGPVRADGVYAIPGDIDVAAFPIVDVSVEPPDGVPTHSGKSVLRGTLA